MLTIQLVLPATLGLHLFWQTYPYFRALYVISVRRTKSLLTASFRFHLTMDTLAVLLYTSSLPRRVRDFHPLERAHGAQTKTHIACALCVTALHQMRTVKYIRANYLLQESAHAHSEDNYYEYSNKMAGYDLLVIDDFGLMDLNLDKYRDLFEIIEARDCRKSTVIISQMPVANWYQLFGDNTYADACLSRMTSKAYRLDFPGRDRRVESK